mgnify:FL=1
MSTFDITKPSLPAVLAVTQRQISKRPFLEQIAEICQHQPQALLLREKDLPEESYLPLAKQVQSICMAHQVLFIPHTYWRVAQQLGCSVVHLPLPLLRLHHADLPKGMILGTSVHSLAEAQEGVCLGAGYVSAGHIYPTACKQGVPARGLDFLREICQQTPLPVYAIGGIHQNSSQIPDILRCGAAGYCMMSDFMRI